MLKTKNFLILKGLGSLLVAILGLAGASQSLAASIIVTSGPANSIVEDNDANDLSPQLGVVLTSGSAAQWNVTTSTGLSRPVLGNAGEAIMDLTSVSLASGGATIPITIEFWDNNYTSSGNISFASSIGGTLDGADIEWSVCIDDANGTTCSATAGSGSFSGEGAFSENFAGLASVTGPFAIGLVAEIAPSIVGSEVVASFDFQTTQVIPLPAGAWLFGSALLGLVAVKRRKA